MKRFLAPLALILVTGPALAGITFEVPRFDFPAPTAPTITDTVSSQGK